MSATREKFPHDVRKYEWLGPLLDIFDNVDRKVEEHIYKRSPGPVCKKGCAACCHSMDVSLTRPELNGISWYVSEKLSGSTRSEVRNNLLSVDDSKACPFLIDNCCSVYPMRPITCRIFHVKNKVCEMGECVDETRPQDILSFGRDAACESGIMLLKLLGYDNCEIEFENGAILNEIESLYDIDLSRIVMVMDVIGDQGK